MNNELKNVFIVHQFTKQSRYLLIKLILQDIRSYLVKTDGSNKKKDLNNTISSHEKGKSSKKRHVLSSDDEDDVIPPTPVNKSKQKLPEKRKLINPADVFGSEPVKQTTINAMKQKKNHQVRIYIMIIFKRFYFKYAGKYYCNRVPVKILLSNVVQPWILIG